MTKIRSKITKKILKQVEENARVSMDIPKNNKVKVIVFNDYDEDGDYKCFGCDSSPNFKIEYNENGCKNEEYYCGRC
jgi:hypothetical protein